MIAISMLPINQIEKPVSIIDGPELYNMIDPSSKGVSYERVRNRRDTAQVEGLLQLDS